MMNMQSVDQIIELCRQQSTDVMLINQLIQNIIETDLVHVLIQMINDPINQMYALIVLKTIVKGRQLELSSLSALITAFIGGKFYLQRESMLQQVLEIALRNLRTSDFETVYHEFRQNFREVQDEFYFSIVYIKSRRNPFYASQEIKLIIMNQIENINNRLDQWNNISANEQVSTLELLNQIIKYEPEQLSSKLEIIQVFIWTFIKIMQEEIQLISEVVVELFTNLLYQLKISLEQHKQGQVFSDYNQYLIDFMKHNSLSLLQLVNIQPNLYLKTKLLISLIQVPCFFASKFSQVLEILQVTLTFLYDKNLDILTPCLVIGSCASLGIQVYEFLQKIINQIDITLQQLLEFVNINSPLYHLSLLCYVVSLNTCNQNVTQEVLEQKQKIIQEILGSLLLVSQGQSVAEFRLHLFQFQILIQSMQIHTFCQFKDLQSVFFVIVSNVNNQSALDAICQLFVAIAQFQLIHTGSQILFTQQQFEVLLSFFVSLQHNLVPPEVYNDALNGITMYIQQLNQSEAEYGIETSSDASFIVLTALAKQKYFVCPEDFYLVTDLFSRISHPEKLFVFDQLIVGGLHVFGEQYFKQLDELERIVEVRLKAQNFPIISEIFNVLCIDSLLLRRLGPVLLLKVELVGAGDRPLLIQQAVVALSSTHDRVLGRLCRVMLALLITNDAVGVEICGNLERIEIDEQTLDGQNHRNAVFRLMQLRMNGNNERSDVLFGESEFSFLMNFMEKEISDLSFDVLGDSHLRL